MKFKEGKIIDRFYVKTGELTTIRFPRKTDVRGLAEYINSLVKEKARILLNKKQSLKQEEKWLADLIQKNKENMNIAIVVEAEGKIIGLDELRSFKIPESIAAGKRIKLIQSSYFSDNHPSAKLHKSLGFRVCGRIPKAAKFGDKYLDEVILYKAVEK